MTSVRYIFTTWLNFLEFSTFLKFFQFSQTLFSNMKYGKKVEILKPMTSEMESTSVYPSAFHYRQASVSVVCFQFIRSKMQDSSLCIEMAWLNFGMHFVTS